MKILKQSLEVINDLYLQLFPIRPKNEIYKFAFIVHPRSRKDIERKFPFFRFVPVFCVDLLTKHFWPITISNISGLVSLKSGKPIDGYVISILPTARQLMEDRKLAGKRIMQACKLAKKRGAKIVGLGGLTSSLTKGGLDLLKTTDINITTGHAYTSYNVTQNIFLLSKAFNLDKKKITVGIVGAAGSVGSTSCKILVREGYLNFVIVDLERKKQNCHLLYEEAKRINPEVNIQISHKVSDISNSDIIIAATNAPEAIIQSKDLKYGAIIVDDAQPSDVHEDVFLRKDVLVIEAGVTYTPNINSNFNFGLKNKNDNFCCLAEVMILAAQEWDKHYVINRASLDMVDEISKTGKELGFKVGSFQNFFEAITDEKINYVRECINK